MAGVSCTPMGSFVTAARHFGTANALGLLLVDVPVLGNHGLNGQFSG